MPSTSLDTSFRMTPLTHFLAMDIWEVLADERRATADLLAGLTEEQWAAPSLCPAWTVKDVAVHLVPTTGKGWASSCGRPSGPGGTSTGPASRWSPSTPPR